MYYKFVLNLYGFWVFNFTVVVIVVVVVLNLVCWCFFLNPKVDMIDQIIRLQTTKT